MAERRIQLKRLQKEIIQLQKFENPSITAGPIEVKFKFKITSQNDMFNWHFTIRGPPDSEYQEGIYHGKIEFPVEYPMKPPDLYFFTQNGRYETNTKICLSVTRYHPEEWSPSWTMRTMLEGIVSTFTDKEKHMMGLGSLKMYSQEELKRLALQSQKYVCEKCGPIIKLLPQMETQNIIQQESSKPELVQEAENKPQNYDEKQKSQIQNQEIGSDLKMSGTSQINQNDRDKIQEIIQLQQQSQILYFQQILVAEKFNSFTDLFIKSAFGPANYQKASLILKQYLNQQNQGLDNMIQLLDEQINQEKLQQTNIQDQKQEAKQKETEPQLYKSQPSEDQQRNEVQTSNKGQNKEQLYEEFKDERINLFDSQQETLPPQIQNKAKNPNEDDQQLQSGISEQKPKEQLIDEEFKSNNTSFLDNPNLSSLMSDIKKELQEEEQKQQQNDQQDPNNIGAFMRHEFKTDFGFQEFMLSAGCIFLMVYIIYIIT